MDTGILRIFRCFSRMWRTGAMYNADKIGEGWSLTDSNINIEKERGKIIPKVLFSSSSLGNLKRKEQP